MILLSFDIEEFDMPLEYGREIEISEQIQVSSSGTRKILDLLEHHKIKATFYCTANFANHQPDLIKEIVSAGHELASHGYFHSKFSIEDLKASKERLEELSGVKLKGYRMARMMPVSEKEIAKAGYVYNSSINPTYLPGRYNKLNVSRTWFMKEGVLQLPASVTPFRFPLFWLSFHNLPKFLYRLFANWTYHKDGYLNIYFHPWEFEEIGPKTKYNFPTYVTRNTGNKMVERLEQFILWAIQKGYVFDTTSKFVDSILK